MGVQRPRPLAICAALAASLTLSLSVSVATADTPKIARVSNETTLSRWANPNDRSWIRAAPRANARRVGRLHLNTEDRLPEVYLVLRQATHDDGSIWYQIRIPKRPNGRTGWVPEISLGPLQTVTT